MRKGFYFLNGAVFLKENKYVFEPDNFNFTPFTIQMNFSQSKFDNADSLYIGTNSEKLIQNLTPHEDLIFEHMGYILAFEHSGVSLIINGSTSIGKSTMVEMIEYAFTRKRGSTLKGDIAAEDLMTNKGDKFALSSLENKAI